ncbi:hypothetical protein SCAR479_10852 [Seiridium cardinale]|uniref:Uncharacterized protein n=1 Tax=Seiridium cardinale TaxID=138064 RepID=A0ABR2XFK2_9PEZI
MLVMGLKSTAFSQLVRKLFRERIIINRRRRYREDPFITIRPTVRVPVMAPKLPLEL